MMAQTLTNDTSNPELMSLLTGMNLVNRKNINHQRCSYEAGRIINHQPTLLPSP
jgi:hypothetical protein